MLAFNLFLNDDKTRKSPLAVYSFFLALVYCVIFGVFYALLTDPLHHLINTGNQTVSTVLQALIMSLAGALVCCLFFFLRDKRIALGGFAFMALLLLIAFLATFLLEATQRLAMRQFLLLYGLGPVLVGNLAGLAVYSILLNRSHHTSR